MKTPTRAALARYQQELERDGYLSVTVAAGDTVSIHRRVREPGWQVMVTKKRRLINSRTFPAAANVGDMLGHGLALLDDERRV